MPPIATPTPYEPARSPAVDSDRPSTSSLNVTVSGSLDPWRIATQAMSSSSASAPGLRRRVTTPSRAARSSPGASACPVPTTGVCSPDGQERGDDPEDGADGQHDPGTELVGQDPRDDEPDEDGRTVHERRPPVGRHEVTGAAREQGQGREVRRPDREDRDRRGGPADEHDPQRGIQEQHDRGESRAHGDGRVRQRQGAPPGQSVEVARPGAGPARWPAAAWRRRRSRRAWRPPARRRPGGSPAIRRTR